MRNFLLSRHYVQATQAVSGHRVSGTVVPANGKRITNVSCVSHKMQPGRVNDMTCKETESNWVYSTLYQKTPNKIAIDLNIALKAALSEFQKKSRQPCNSSNHFQCISWKTDERVDIQHQHCAVAKLYPTYFSIGPTHNNPPPLQTPRKDLDIT